ARRRVHAAILIAVGYMGLCGVVFYVFRHSLIGVFARAGGNAGVSPAESAEMIRIGAQVLICAAVFQTFDAVGIVFIGALRGAGDTLWPMLVTFGSSWGVIVGGGVAAIAFLPQLTSIGPWMAASLYVIMIGPLMWCRFEFGAWRNIDLLGRRPAAPAVSAAPLPIVGPTSSAEAANQSEPAQQLREHTDD
ncbi:hypothetical protein LCGC14_1658080, partial [marine sediment metagenome]